MKTTRMYARRSRRLALAVAVLATSPALALMQAPAAGAAQEDYLALQPTGIQDVIHLEWIEHSFGFYSGAPAAEIEKRLPPGFELDSCLKHRVPGATLLPGTADFLLEAARAHVVELGVTTGIASLLTCVKPGPAALGYPQPYAADEGYAKALGLPSAPLVFTLDMWLDAPAAVEHSQRHGMTAEPGQIAFEYLPGDMGWKARVADADGPLFDATFPTLPLDAEGRAAAGCVPYRQFGHVFEWEPGQQTMGVLGFTHFVDGPDGDPADEIVAGQLCPTGGAYTWPADGRIAALVGPPRPATIIGQQLEPEGMYDYLTLQRYQLLPRGER